MTLNKENNTGESAWSPDLKRKLLGPLQTELIELKLNSFRTERVFPGTKEHEAAADIVNENYNRLYSTNGNTVDVARDNFNNLDTTITLVTTQEFNNQKIVLGTLRFICGNKLDIDNLLEMEEGKHWPHEQDGIKKKPGEIGKLSFHPIISERGLGVSDLDSARMRAKIARDLYENGLREMRGAGVEIPYFIFARHVLRFAESVGVSPCVKVEGAKPKQSEEARIIRQTFSRYWNPNKDPIYQPSLYIAPWNLQAIKS